MTGVPSAVSFRTPLALVSLVSLVGCVSPEVQKQRTRVAEYRAALATLKPNSSRAELRRLFPAMAKAEPHTELLALPHHPSPAPTIYRDDLELTVRSIGMPSKTPSGEDISRMPGSPEAKNMSTEIHPLGNGLALSVHFEYRHYREIKPAPQFPTSRGGPITPLEIDAMLFGGQGVLCRVYPSPRDRIIAAPVLLMGVKGLPTSTYAPLPNSVRSSTPQR